MPLRDQLAAAYVQAQILTGNPWASVWPRDDGLSPFEAMARDAYHMADAMLRARQEKSR